MNNYNISINFGSSNITPDCNTTIVPPLSSLSTKTRTIMTTLLYTCVYILSLYTTPIPASAQVIHQSFEMGERKAITLSLDTPYEVETWAGNTILTETKVQMDNIPPKILKHFINQGRYEIIENNSETAIELSLKKANRRTIRTKSGEAAETINIKVYVPEDCIVNQLGKGNLEVEQTGE